LLLLDTDLMGTIGMLKSSRGRADCFTVFSDVVDIAKTLYETDLRHHHA